MRIGEEITCHIHGGTWTVAAVDPWPGGKGPEYGTPVQLQRGCRSCGVRIECDAPPPPGPPRRTITHDGYCAACRDARRGCDDKQAAESAARARLRGRKRGADTRDDLGHMPLHSVGDQYGETDAVVLAVSRKISRADKLPRTLYTIERPCKTCGEAYTQIVGHNATLNANCLAHRTPKGRAAWRAAHDAAF